MDFDFLSNNLYLPYPFRDSVQIERLTAAGPIEPFCVSAQIRTTDQREEELQLQYLNLRSTVLTFATLVDASLRLKWSTSDEQVNIDGAAYATVYTYGSWIVAKWLSDDASVAATLVFPSSAVETSGDYYIQAEALHGDVVFQQSAVKQGPNKLKRVFIKQGDVLTQVVAPGEEFSIAKGFNMSIEGQDVVQVGGRELKPVAIDAIPGAGRGRYLICRRNAYLLTLTGVPPGDNGNVKLSPEECYWLELPLSGDPTPVEPPERGIDYSGAVTPSAVQLHNACGPCCSCEDYIATYDHLRNIWDRARVVSDGFYDLRAGYYGLIAKYIEIIEGLTGLLTLQQYLDDYMLLTLVVRNTSAETVSGVSTSLTISSTAGTVSYVEGTGFLASTLAKGLLDPTALDTDPTVTFAFDIPPQAVVGWSSMWRLNDMVAEDEVTVTAIVSGISDSETETLTIE